MEGCGGGVDRERGGDSVFLDLLMFYFLMEDGLVLGVFGGVVSVIVGDLIGIGYGISR